MKIPFSKNNLWSVSYCTKFQAGRIWNPVYTIQPVVKQVVQPVWQPAVSCKQTSNRLSNRLSNGFDNRFDKHGLTTVLNEQIVRSTGCQPGLYNRFDNGLDNRLNVCIHDTAGCQTGCQTGLTTGCIVYTYIYPVVKPVWQPVWQQIVSCKRGLMFTHSRAYNLRKHKHSNATNFSLAKYAV